VKKTKRSRTKYPNLYPELNLKTRFEEISDINSYIGKLNDEEKAWLNKFVGESINASFSKNNSENLHKRKAQRLEAYTRNNARNRDILTKAKAMGDAVYIEDLKIKDVKSKVSTEDTLIEELDSKNGENLKSTNNSRKHKRHNSK
jgi:hypothetical protein